MVKIVVAPGFYESLAGKHLLLDTSVFIDSMNHWGEFQEFLNKLKATDITVVTIQMVLGEFCLGVETEEKFDRRKEIVDEIVEKVYLPVDTKAQEKMLDLLRLYKVDAKGVSMTDLAMDLY